MRRILPLLFLLFLLSIGAASAQSTNSWPAGGNDNVFGGTKGEDESGVFLPNAFTPNGDGVNDVYYIPDANFLTFEFSVYDRWGNRVFFSDSPSFRWNGESNGRQVPTGVYVFVLTASTSKKADIKRSGTITIVR